jgi:hypothetical protein
MESAFSNPAGIAVAGLSVQSKMALTELWVQILSFPKVAHFVIFP